MTDGSRDSSDDADRGEPAAPPSGRAGPPAGHRARPHTADAVVEAWGRTRAECLEQAVAGLVAGFVGPADAEPEPAALEIEAEDDEELVVLLLEEVLYRIEVHGVVPVAATLDDTPTGVAGSFLVVPVSAAREVGAVPKAVSRSGLSLRPREDGGWWCRATIDV